MKRNDCYSMHKETGYPSLPQRHSSGAVGSVYLLLKHFFGYLQHGMAICFSFLWIGTYLSCRSFVLLRSIREVSGGVRGRMLLFVSQNICFGSSCLSVCVVLRGRATDEWRKNVEEWEAMISSSVSGEEEVVSKKKSVDG